MREARAEALGALRQSSKTASQAPANAGAHLREIKSQAHPAGDWQLTLAPIQNSPRIFGRNLPAWANSRPGVLLDWGPRRSPAKRVWRGEEEGTELKRNFRRQPEMERRSFFRRGPCTARFSFLSQEREKRNGGCIPRPRARGAKSPRSPGGVEPPLKFFPAPAGSSAGQG